MAFIAKRNWFLDYTFLILQKDVLDLSKIENITEMPKLLTLLASRVASLLKVEESDSLTACPTSMLWE